MLDGGWGGGAQWWGRGGVCVCGGGGGGELFSRSGLTWTGNDPFKLDNSVLT